MRLLHGLRPGVQVQPQHPGKYLFYFDYGRRFEIGAVVSVKQYDRLSLGGFVDAVLLSLPFK